MLTRNDKNVIKRLNKRRKKKRKSTVPGRGERLWWVDWKQFHYAIGMCTSLFLKLNETSRDGEHKHTVLNLKKEMHTWKRCVCVCWMNNWHESWATQGTHTPIGGMVKRRRRGNRCERVKERGRNANPNQFNVAQSIGNSSPFESALELDSLRAKAVVAAALRADELLLFQKQCLLLLLLPGNTSTGIRSV